MGGIRLGFDHCQPLDSVEVTISANEGCVDGQRRRSNPEVVFIERKAAAVLGSLDVCIPVTGCRWDRFTRQNSEQTQRLHF